MASVNKVILVGNLGQDPEVRTFPSGDLVANVSIATTDRWRDKNTGENREHTEWHRVMFAGRLAEIAEQYLRKGSQIYVEGSLRTRKWTDQQGVERYTTEIRADSMQMLGSRQDGGGQRYSNDDQDQGRGGNSGGGYGGGRGGYDRGGNGGRGSNDDQRRQANDQRQYDDRGGQRSGGDNRGGQGGDRSTNGGGSRQGGQSNPPRQQQSQQQKPQRGGGGGSSGFDDMDDDIPFLSNSMAFDMESKLDRRIRKAMV